MKARHQVFMSNVIFVVVLLWVLTVYFFYYKQFQPWFSKYFGIINTFYSLFPF